MLFNLLVASITILLCFFFLFCVVFNSFFIIPVNIENVRLKVYLLLEKVDQLSDLNLCFVHIFWDLTDICWN